MLSDLRYTLRGLAHSPGFAFVAIFTLALGIGANTAIFSIVNSALLRPLPYPDAGRLVQLWTVASNGNHFPASRGLQFKQWREHATSFEGVGAINDRFALNLIADGHAERITGGEVSVNYLDVLGLHLLLGRGFQAGADQVGGQNHVVILSHAWWRTRFGGDPNIIGRTINFNQVSYTVVAVLPPNALPQDRLNFLVPLVLESSPWRLDPSIPWLCVTARLKPGVTVVQAESEVAALNEEFFKRVLPGEKVWPSLVLPMQEILTENSRPTFLMLLGAVGLVLLIACANVANLLLVRATGRQKEMAVRLALGAGTGGIIRLLVTESVVLSLSGGALGLALASFSAGLLRHLTASSLPGLMQPEIDGRVLAFSFLLAAVTGVVFGLVPALQICRKDVVRGIKDTGRGLTSATRTRTQSGLVISEVALTVMLLVCACLLLRSFARVLASDAGFNPHQALVCDLSLTDGKFKNEKELIQFEHELVRRLQAVPGVESVGTVTTLPLSKNSWGTRLGLPELPVAEQNTVAGIDYVGGDYFKAMGVRLLKGRVFTEADNSTKVSPVIVINESLAASQLPGVDPIGRRLRFSDIDWEIIGVVSNVRHMAFDGIAEAHVYAVHAYKPNDVCLVLRTKVPPLSLVEEIRRVSAGLDPDQSIANFRSLDEAVSQSLQERRVTLQLLGAFAFVALALACLGIYGVMAYTIRQRERELGIRLALGAHYHNIIGQVLRDGGRLGLVGIGVGLVGALLGGRLIASRLYEISAFDPLIFAFAPFLVALVVFAAIWVPARRAAKVDPMVALRAE